MSENMNLGTRIDVGNTMSLNGTWEKYCYNDVEDSCSVYGGFYAWAEVMFEYVSGQEGVCPQGWRLPSNNDWCILSQHVDPTVICTNGYLGTDAGYKLKSSYGWFSSGNGSDAYGFTALPAGFVDYTSVYNGEFARFWASDFGSGSSSHFWDMYYASQQIFMGQENIQYGFSVRCVGD
jgi:uncharacterized protein (TIGR02145 family)